MRLATSRAGLTAAFLVIVDAIIASCAVPTAFAQFLAMPARVNAADPADQKAPEFLKSLINTELSFLKRACEPSDEQMQQLVAAAKENSVAGGATGSGNVATPPGSRSPWGVGRAAGASGQSRNVTTSGAGPPMICSAIANRSGGRIPAFKLSRIAATQLKWKS